MTALPDLETKACVCVSVSVMVNRITENVVIVITNANINLFGLGQVCFCLAFACEYSDFADEDALQIIVEILKEILK